MPDTLPQAFQLTLSEKEGVLLNLLVSVPMAQMVGDVPKLVLLSLAAEAFTKENPEAAKSLLAKLDVLPTTLPR